MSFVENRSENSKTGTGVWFVIRHILFVTFAQNQGRLELNMWKEKTYKKTAMVEVFNISSTFRFRKKTIESLSYRKQKALCQRIKFVLTLEEKSKKSLN